MESSRRYVIRPYQPSDERGWLRCRVLAFLETAYYDDVCREKELYESRSIELVAELDGEIVGLIDVECEEKPGTICSKREGMIWHLAVHPDYRRQGIGTALLIQAEKRATKCGIKRFEAWTRDDDFVEQWYCSQGFEWIESYYHVYMEHEEIKEVIGLDIPGLRPLSVFAHYSGGDAEIPGKFKRVHKCNRYELCFGGEGSVNGKR